MSAVICEPLKDGVLLSKRISEVKPRRVLLIFWHGVGDLVMFLPLVEALRAQYSDYVTPEAPAGANVRGFYVNPLIEFVVGVPKGLCYKDLVPDAVELEGDEVNNDEITSKLPYDLVAKITFPMNEGQDVFTKGEFCCIHELGIRPTWGHARRIPSRGNPIVAVHFNITCLPDSCNPDRETAEKIWDDVRRAGFVPLEVHFEHAFHNPVNKKFDFIDATVRRCEPRLKSLVGILEHAHAFVGVVSGPFHVAMSVLGPSKCLLLEKDFKREHFTKEGISHANLREYKGEVFEWLKGTNE